MTVVTYTLATETLTLDTTQAGYGPKGTWDAILAISRNNILQLDILLDRTLVEIFGSDGTAITASIYPRYQESTGIVLVADDRVVAATQITLTHYRSSWN
jgi:sucrose-6-phosphate hydrolase SacC (GH32 family)